MSGDTELFRRTKYASWSIMASSHGDGNPETMYGHHRRCSTTKEDAKSGWSWFIGDPNECFNCKVKVPDYIQTLIRLYVGM